MLCWCLMENTFEMMLSDLYLSVNGFYDLFCCIAYFGQWSVHIRKRIIANDFIPRFIFKSLSVFLFIVMEVNCSNFPEFVLFYFFITLFVSNIFLSIFKTLYKVDSTISLLYNKKEQFSRSK